MGFVSTVLTFKLGVRNLEKYSTYGEDKAGYQRNKQGAAKCEWILKEIQKETLKLGDQYSYYYIISTTIVTEQIYHLKQKS